MAETKILKINPDKPEENLVEEAARIIRDGGIVAFPTETVYGLAANLENKNTIERLYRIKSRPKDKPFTIHISSLDMISRFGCGIPHLARVLIDKFWPGPLTIILKNPNESLGFRMPRNKIASMLIEKSGVPVAAPSANISGEKPAVTAEEVASKFFGKIDAIIDGGRTLEEMESTVIDSTRFPFRVVREGAIQKSRIADAWSHAAGK